MQDINNVQTSHVQNTQIFYICIMYYMHPVLSIHSFNHSYSFNKHVDRTQQV